MTGTGFEEDGPPPAASALVLRLASYEGPLDFLLDQARAQKVDLAQVSILALAEQYLAFIEEARSLRLDLAADYLVMAAWLAYLKSRLLLPPEHDEEEPSAVEMAEALQFQLRRLEAIRQASASLQDRPRLGHDRFLRGRPEEVAARRRPVWDSSLIDLLRAYGAIRRRQEVRGGGLTIEASRLMSIEEAAQRLTRALGGVVGWTSLYNLLPSPSRDPLRARSVLSASFAASLELARQGAAELRQDEPFAPLYLRARSDGAMANES